MVNPRVDDRHQVERLHDIGAVLASDRVVGDELEVSFKCANLVEDAGVDLGGVTADLQHREDERTELVSHGDAGEGHLDVGAHTTDLEGRAAWVGAVKACGDHRGERSNFFEEGAHLGSVGRIVKGGD